MVDSYEEEQDNAWSITQLRQTFRRNYKHKLFPTCIQQPGSVHPCRAKESSWDLGTDDRLASGIYHPSDGDETGVGEPYGTSQDQEVEESTSSSWRDQASGQCDNSFS